eukprot:6171925-Pleurochrysis_carterae.AAC.2
MQVRLRLRQSQEFTCNGVGVGQAYHASQPRSVITYLKYLQMAARKGCSRKLIALSQIRNGCQNDIR